MLHELGTIIAAIAAAIAAVSSLKNGRTLNGKSSHGTPKVLVRVPKKRTSNGESKGDWYKSPDLAGGTQKASKRK